MSALLRRVLACCLVFRNTRLLPKRKLLVFGDSLSDGFMSQRSELIQLYSQKAAAAA